MQESMQSSESYKKQKKKKDWWRFQVIAKLSTYKYYGHYVSKIFQLYFWNY